MLNELRKELMCFLSIIEDEFILVKKLVMYLVFGELFFD